VSALLFLALVAVYLLGVGGIVVAGALLRARRFARTFLRLEVARSRAQTGRVTDLALRTHPELLVDSRGHALRATWHPDESEVVLGVWDDSRCVGTVRLDPSGAARLGAFLLASLAAAATPPESAVTD
jgi:hypothetical protein